MHLHSDIAALPAGASELAGHAEHALSPVAPTAPEYFPDPHSRHAPLPAFILYVPSTHAVHVPPSAPVKPALHLQLTADVLPPGASELAGHVEHALSPVAPTAPEYFPDPHSRHAPVPAFILYVPSTHAVHVPPSVPV